MPEPLLNKRALSFRKKARNHKKPFFLFLFFIVLVGHVEILSLCKTYNRSKVIDNITAEFGDGLHVIYGVNGSGKTTFLSMIAGVTKPSSGRVILNGQVSYMPQEPMLYDELKVRDYLTILKTMSNVDVDAARKLLNILKISLESHVHMLSYGMKKALYFTLSSSLPADVYVLDEPMLGIDPGRQETFTGVIRELSRNSVVILSESERVLEPRYILKGGVLHEI